MSKVINVVVLAAGKGTRMKSDLPKVLHKICGHPLLYHVLRSVEKLNVRATYVVVGYMAEKVKETFKKQKVYFVLQKEQLGTGHAVMQAEPFLKGPGSTVLVLNGDMPLITPQILKELIAHHEQKKASATVLTAVLENPDGYGRIVRDGHGDIEKIVEQKDSSLSELEIKEINTGTYCFESKDLFGSLSGVRPENAQNEYYLTDVIDILRKKHKRIAGFKVGDPRCALGINTVEQLAEAEKALMSGKGK